MRLIRVLLAACGVLAIAAATGCNTVQGMADDLTPAQAAEPPAVVAPATFKNEPEIRVRIVKAATQKRLSGVPSVTLRPTSTTGKTVVAHTPLTITSGLQGIMVAEASGKKHTWPFGSDVEVVVADGNAPGRAATASAVGAAGPGLRLDGAKFPGFLTISPAWHEAPAKFDVIATMQIEEYLPGVVTAELWKGWPAQTNQAQAVAARTYALFERNRARGEGRAVDVESTTSDQVFAAAVTPAAMEAVRATRGMVLAYDGQLLRAYFSSQCGGRPASAAAVWPADYAFNRSPTLQGEPRQWYCQRSPLYRWTITRSDDDVSRRLRAWGHAASNGVASIGRLRSVEVASKNDAGRPNAYRVTDDQGREYKLKAEELRNGLNQAVSGLPAITRQNEVHSGDMEVEVWANEVRFVGRGWGHGVGMCQWCAKGMAEQGIDWASMMRVFYPGVEIVRGY